MVVEKATIRYLRWRIIPGMARNAECGTTETWMSRLSVGEYYRDKT